jgi:hypothetical protein
MDSMTQRQVCRSSTPTERDVIGVPAISYCHFPALHMKFYAFYTIYPRVAEFSTRYDLFKLSI